MYVKDKTKIRPILFGGGHQRGMRSGTENVPGVAGLGQAAMEACENLKEKQDYLYGLRRFFVQSLCNVPWAHINGAEQGPESVTSGEHQVYMENANIAPHIVSVSFDWVRSEVLLHALEDRGIYVSAGSACSSNKPAVSETLKSIGLSREYLDTTVRFSFSVYNTVNEVRYCIHTLEELVPQLQRFTRH